MQIDTSLPGFAKTALASPDFPSGRHHFDQGEGLQGLCLLYYLPLSSFIR